LYTGGFIAQQPEFQLRSLAVLNPVAFSTAIARAWLLRQHRGGGCGAMHVAWEAMNVVR
jgi:hypothetical protein